jgi:hypothetical protein
MEMAMPRTRGSYNINNVIEHGLKLASTKIELKEIVFTLTSAEYERSDVLFTLISVELERSDILFLSNLNDF